MRFILIREFNLEIDSKSLEQLTVYTGRDTVMPVNPISDWINQCEKWADHHIYGWSNIQCFVVPDDDCYVVQR
jgi:hypothetical protein